MSFRDRWQSFREKLKWLDPFTYVDLWVMPKVNPNKNKTVEWIVYIVFAFIFALVLYTVLGMLLQTRSPMVIVLSGSMEPTMYRGDVVVLSGVTPENIKGPQVELDFDVSDKPLSEYASLDYANQTINFTNGESIVLGREGDVPVYFADLGNIQIIHRVVAKIKTPQGYYLLTKGDNPVTNVAVDQDCGKLFAQQMDNQYLYQSSKQWYLSANQSCYCSTRPINDLVKNEACIACVQKPCNTLYAVKASEIEGVAVFRVPWLGYVKLLPFDDLPRLLLGKSLN
jgi:signal peptidase I